jgi:hypothetical protein
MAKGLFKNGDRFVDFSCIGFDITQIEQRPYLDLEIADLFCKVKGLFKNGDRFIDFSAIIPLLSLSGISK